MSTCPAAPVLSVIVVTWNGKEFALECLESILGQPLGVSAEAIVVDNASSDGTPEAIHARFPQITLIVNEKNLGFARANNIGIAASRGKYLCLVNSDVVIPAGCLERIVAYLEAHGDIGLLGPKMLRPDGSVGHSVMRLPTLWNSLCCALGLHSVFPRSALFGGYMRSGYPYDKIDDVEVLTGWFWVVPRAVLEQVGGLDERFFMYGEDIDWCHRFLESGWRVVFFPDAEALHYGGASSARAPARFHVEMRRANLQYFRKHSGPLPALAYRMTTWIHEMSRVLGYSAVYCLIGKRRSEAAFKIARSLSCIRWLAGDHSAI